MDEPKNSLSALSFSEKREIVLKNNYEHVLDYGFYDPIISGSIDGSDEIAHDRALVRSLNSRYLPNKAVKTKSKHTIFVGRLNFQTNEELLQSRFEKYGKISSIRVVRDLITGFSRGYGFVEFKHKSDAVKAFKDSHGLIIDGKECIVEHELERRVDGWKPRRFGGGLGGFKQSGQLRFGGRTKPFGKIFKTKLSRNDNNISHRHTSESSHKHDKASRSNRS